MNLNKCVLSFLNTTSKLLYRRICDISGLEICDSNCKVGNEPPADGWRTYDADIPFKAYDAHFWIRASFRTPSVAENEYLVFRTVTGREGLWDATNSPFPYFVGILIISNNHIHFQEKYS